MWLIRKKNQLLGPFTKQELLKQNFDRIDEISDGQEWVSLSNVQKIQAILGTYPIHEPTESTAIIEPSKFNQPTSITLLTGIILLISSLFFLTAIFLV